MAIMCQLNLYSFFFLLLILQCSSVSYAFFYHSSVQFAISYKNVYLICKNQKTTKNDLKECRSLFVKKQNKKRHVLQCTSAGEVCEAIHHLPFSFFFLSLCHTSLLSLQCACCWVMWSLWPASLSCHMQQPSATSGHDWSMPQLQWQLVISATSGHHSVHEYSVKKTTHVHLYKHIAQFVWLMVVFFSFPTLLLFITL